ncbi:MAG: class I SAM-dependent methyltransferase [Gammaproteobacteria bacterium]|nr:class I SAM-dependent methyltransferase [Gammaproteobacteria bacterium]
MSTTYKPVTYEAWYHTPRGQWVGSREFHLLWKLLQPTANETLLDVGCGSGYFSRHFSQAGIHVTGLDPDMESLLFACDKSEAVDLVQGNAQALPFTDNYFDYCMAVTSLCFIENPVCALNEMLRVSRKGVVLGLLNRNSFLYTRKKEKGAYVGARWDSVSDVKRWVKQLEFAVKTEFRSALFLPGGGLVPRSLEPCLPSRLTVGGFLAVHIAAG